MSRADEQMDSNLLEVVEIEIAEPPMFNVIFINDDYTPMDFVMAILSEIFHKDEDSAVQITMRVHEEGSAVVATYPEDIAKMKQRQASALAQEAQFPLLIEIEPEAPSKTPRPNRF